MNANEYVRERRKKLRVKRLCPQCSTRKAKRGYVTCELCLSAATERARLKRQHERAPF